MQQTIFATDTVSIFGTEYGNLPIVTRPDVRSQDAAGSPRIMQSKASETIDLFPKTSLQIVPYLLHKV